MVLRKNSVLFFAAGLVALSVPALAQNYSALSRSDFISMSAGDAKDGNMAIHSPTPWPAYVNDTNIRVPARQGTSALEKMFKRYENQGSSGPSTVINVGPQSQ